MTDTHPRVLDGLVPASAAPPRRIEDDSDSLDLLRVRRRREADRNDGWVPDEAVCYAHRVSRVNPDHEHTCTAPAGHRYDDGHVCPCGDWWHSD